MDEVITMSEIRDALDNLILDELVIDNRYWNLS